ncbi:hypothetical protein GCM10010306_103130 [Streptomyces umbrinus]|nr:hypothetical protein GCM10010306_103130 [Streptomyces umbrinus]
MCGGLTTTVGAYDAEVGDHGETGRAESADQVGVAAGCDLRAARRSGGGGPQQPGSVRCQVSGEVDDRFCGSGGGHGRLVVLRFRRAAAVKRVIFRLERGLGEGTAESMLRGSGG